MGDWGTGTGEEPSVYQAGESQRIDTPLSAEKAPRFIFPMRHQHVQQKQRTQPLRSSNVTMAPLVILRHGTVYTASVLSPIGLRDL